MGYGEGAGCSPEEYTHYTKGGMPGFFPSIKGKGAVTPLPLDLYDPFGILPSKTDAEKERGRRVEINNGRAAMLGIMAILSASKGLVVPPLNYLPIPQYSGNVMVPFEGDFSFFGHTFNRAIDWAT